MEPRMSQKERGYMRAVIRNETGELMHAEAAGLGRRYFRLSFHSESDLATLHKPDMFTLP